jgi:hypothetical protein
MHLALRRIALAVLLASTVVSQTGCAWIGCKLFGGAVSGAGRSC